MQLLFRQRFFSWFDSYDIYDARGSVVYTVEGKLDWGHRLHVLNAAGEHIATVRERVLSFLPQFEIYIGEAYCGRICKELSFFRPRFTVELGDWQVEGDLFGWDYRITGAGGRLVGSVSKQLLHWTDTYVIDVVQSADALPALMTVLAIDAAACDKN